MVPNLRSIFVPVAMAALVLGCGPSTALIKSYIVTSPRRTVAIMPLSVVEGQRDLSSTCENALRDRLQEYGFLTIYKPGADQSAPVFGPRTAAPRFEDVQAYGRKLGAPVVLVGRIERAQEQKPGKPGVYRGQKRWGTDATGKHVQYTDRVVVKPEQSSVACEFRLDLRLMETETGRTIWSQTAVNTLPNWSLVDVARYICQSKAADVAGAYYSRKF